MTAREKRSLEELEERYVKEIRSHCSLLIKGPGGLASALLQHQLF
jgi:hypothetical protein